MSFRSLNTMMENVVYEPRKKVIIVYFMFV